MAEPVALKASEPESKFQRRLREKREAEARAAAEADAAIAEYADLIPEREQLAAGPVTEKQLMGLYNFVATMSQGNRNTALFWAACTMMEKGVDYQDTVDFLGEAALKCGLKPGEIKATLRSAARKTGTIRIIGGTRS